VSWQLAAFGILAFTLAAGFAWYERSRPDARIVALVGTLAAFAALGRIAFAALPNVKPTTDIVLISGYALGGAPGFAVGALAGLTSNFFFGQGPWTPWQMVAWGATGAFGGGLALLTARRIGRWPLAIVCAVAGFAFTATQDVGDWVTLSDHSPAQLGVYVGKGLGFDAIHAAGCLAFALAFGPALTRSITRFALRLHVTWQPAGAAALLLGAVGAVAFGLSAPPPVRAAATPAGYLLSAQNPDGGFGAAAGQPSSPLFSGWAALGLAAAGDNPEAVSHGGASLLAYVSGGGLAPDVGSLERTILVIRAAGMAPGAIGGHDLVAALQRDVRPDGSVSDQVNLTSFAVLALRAAGVAPAARTIVWLVRQQDGDGGFNFAAAGATSDVDDTGAALQALAGEGGPAARACVRAVGFIRAQQNSDGGLPSQPGGESNAQSTAWGVQGLLAAGVDPGALHRGGAISPLAFLTSLIAPDGHIDYARGIDQTPVWVTAQALMALARKPLPLAPVPVPVPGAAPSAHAPLTHAAARLPRRSVRRARHARAAHHARAAGGRAAAHASVPMLGLATDAALVTALVLAPIGLG
jgi:energy-coupling factor transport system substrate-specific component